MIFETCENLLESSQHQDEHENKIVETTTTNLAPIFVQPFKKQKLHSARTYAQNRPDHLAPIFCATNKLTIK